MDNYELLSGKLDRINDKLSHTQICVEELRGEFKVIRTQLAMKANRSELSDGLMPRQKRVILYTAGVVLSAIGGMLAALLGG